MYIKTVTLLLTTSFALSNIAICIENVDIQTDQEKSDCLTIFPYTSRNFLNQLEELYKNPYVHAEEFLKIETHLKNEENVIAKGYVASIQIMSYYLAGFKLELNIFNSLNSALEHDKENPIFTFSLAHCFLEGLGTEKNLNKAFELYNRINDHIPMACNQLGYMYSNGLGIEKNLEKSIKFYQLAIEHGNAIAMHNLAWAYQNGKGVAQNYEMALQWYQKAADNGYTNSWAPLGLIYENGLGVQKDLKHAFEYYQKAAENGNSKGMHSLAWAYQNGKGVAQNYEMALEWYKKAADKGNTSSMNQIGHLYRNGLGVQKDLKLAFEYYQKAADKGDSSGMHNLAWAYQKGEGVGQNYEMALEWYKKAADKGNTSSMNQIGHLYRNGLGVQKDLKLAFEYYQKAADKGDSSGMHNLAWAYQNGEGVVQNYEMALKWYQKSADNGYTNSWAQLGLIYENGLGVQKDLKHAFECYQKAAENGNSKGMHNLAWAYQNGIGVVQNYKMALEWYKKAADKGYISSMNQIGYLYKNGLGVQKDLKLAFEYYQKAAENGDSTAMHNLAWAYQNGEGIAKNFKKARELFHQAAQQGHVLSMKRLGLMHLNRQGGKKDIKQAAYWLKKAAKNGCIEAQSEIEKNKNIGIQYKITKQKKLTSKSLLKFSVKENLKEIPFNSSLDSQLIQKMEHFLQTDPSWKRFNSKCEAGKTFYQQSNLKNKFMFILEQAKYIQSFYNISDETELQKKCEDLSKKLNVLEMASLQEKTGGTEDPCGLKKVYRDFKQSGGLYQNIDRLNELYIRWGNLCDAVQNDSDLQEKFHCLNNLRSNLNTCLYIYTVKDFASSQRILENHLVICKQGLNKYARNVLDSQNKAKIENNQNVKTAEHFILPKEKIKIKTKGEINSELMKKISFAQKKEQELSMEKEETNLLNSNLKDFLNKLDRNLPKLKIVKKALKSSESLMELLDDPNQYLDGTHCKLILSDMKKLFPLIAQTKENGFCESDLFICSLRLSPSHKERLILIFVKKGTKHGERILNEDTIVNWDYLNYHQK